jgi:hypothetical protein
MEQLADHPFINDQTDRLTQLNKQTYFLDLEKSAKLYDKSIASD